MSYHEEMTEIQLKRLHNDILLLHLSMLVKEMHDTQMLNDEEYKKSIDQRYKIVSDQLSNVMI